MKVTLRDIDATIDINDDDALVSAIEAIVAKDLKRIPPNVHSRALKGILQNLRYWFIKNGALLAGAHASGAEGITLGAALESHNFIAGVLSEAPLNFETSILADDYEPEANDQEEGADAPAIIMPEPPDEL